MKSTFAAVLSSIVLVAALPATGGCVHASPEPVIVAGDGGPPMEYEPFIEPLSAYGRWLVYEPYGWVWVPTVVSSDWRPYTAGRWLYTDGGWMWMSHEPWGWATYHYGRWFYDGALGWVWVPDTVWGASWVCWRTGPAFYGWAPLPPGYTFGASLGACNPWIGGWVFVDGDWFLSPYLSRYVVPPARNVYVYDRTQPSVETSTSRSPTGNGRVRDIPVPRGPDPGEVSARTGQSLPRYSVESLRPVPGRRPRAVVDGDRIRTTRPEFPREIPPSRIEPTPGGQRLDEPPTRGQHRPEVRPQPDREPPTAREIPPDKRGPAPPVVREKPTQPPPLRPPDRREPPDEER